MKRILLSFLLALPLFGIAYVRLPVPQQSEGKDSINAPVIFKGTIENLKNYTPLPDVVLTLTSMDGSLKKSATTDKSGRFYLAGVPPGNYNLCFEKTGFEKGVCQRLILKADKVNYFGFFMFED